jgi:hypothetical protein
MRGRNRYLAQVLAGLLALSGLLILAPPASAVPSTSNCARVVVFGARGTGETTGFGKMWPLAEKIQKGFTRTVRLQSLKSAQYPATGGDPWTYRNSVNKGAASLRSLMNTLVSRCGTKTDIVLLGYSQGAHVIGDVIDNSGTQLSKTVNSRIKAVVFYGDPTFRAGEPYNSPTWHPFSGMFVRSKGNISKYATRIRSYCNHGDAWCQGFFPAGQGIHTDYNKHDGKAYEFVKKRF